MQWTVFDRPFGDGPSWRERSQPAVKANNVFVPELLDFLLEVSAATVETLDLDKLLANVADIVKKVIDCELFAILLYTEKYQELRIRFAVGHRPEIVDKLTLTLKDGITGAAATRREPILVGDVRNDPRWVFLTGTKDQIIHLSVDGFKLAAGGTTQTAAEPLLHSAKFAIADKDGMIREYYGGTETDAPDHVAATIKDLLKEN